MKKQINYYILLCISAILLHASSVRAMDSGFSLPQWLEKAWSELTNFSSSNQPPQDFSPEHLKTYNHQQPLLLFFYCFGQHVNQVCPLRESLKSFMKLSIICKDFLTTESIGKFFSSYDSDVKNMTLFNLYRSMNDMDDSAYQHIRRAALILIYSGADANTMIGKSYLLTQTIFFADMPTAKVLLEHDADPDIGEGHLPIFYFIRDVKMAEEFVKYGAQVKKTPRQIPVNVLWEVIRSPYPAELLTFYVSQGVDPQQLHPLNNSCLLHELANLNEVDDTKNFIEKAHILLSILPISLIGSRNKQGQTPLDLARASLEISPEAFGQLIELLCRINTLSQKNFKNL